MAGRAPRPRPGPQAAAVTAGRFAIVAARFNERFTKRLLDGALGAFASAGVPAGAVEVHWVPGAFELPQAAAHLARTGRYAGLVCVGCVIRGQTPHFDFVAGQAARGIQEVALQTGVPAAFGVITALTEEQAWERAGGDIGNRGEEAAHAALEMAAFVATVERGSDGRTSGAKSAPTAKSQRPPRRQHRKAG